METSVMERIKKTLKIQGMKRWLLAVKSTNCSSRGPEFTSWFLVLGGS